MRRRYQNLALLFLIFSFLITLACKKHVIEQDAQEEIISPKIGSRTEFTLDSIYLYAKQVYLWNYALPAYNVFKPREKYNGIKPEFDAFEREVFDISQFKTNSITGLPIETPNNRNQAKFSNIQKGRLLFQSKQAGSIDANLILSKRLIQLADKTIAYVAFGSFTALKDSKKKLDEVFDEFAQAKPKYLIVDLRSNRGGYVATAEYIANLIAPTTLNGKVMYIEEFNPEVQAGKALILRHQPYLDENGKPVLYKGRMATLADVDYSEISNTYRFKKERSLESIQHIYFIVSGQTASASELLINCLKPYYEIRLVGEKTFGKPVGFFGIGIDQYTIYLSSFLIKNSVNAADYFTGIEPDIFIRGEVNPDLGNPDELCLKATLDAINRSRKKTTSSTSEARIPIASALSPIKSQEYPSILIESRFKLKH